MKNTVEREETQESFFATACAEMDNWSRTDALPSTYSDSWITGVSIPHPPFLVNGRIPYGIWSHAAEPGGYKSAMAAQIEQRISYETPLPGLSEWEFITTGDCLVIVPDETPEEIQDRSLRITPGGTYPWMGGDWRQAPNQIWYCHDPQGHSLRTRIAWLIETVESIEKATGRRIIWIRWDTLGSLLGHEPDRNAYEAVAPLQYLNHWAARDHMVIYLPNHLGKSGSPIGSVAVAAYSNLATETEITKGAGTGILTVRKMRGGHAWEAGLEFIDGLVRFCDHSPLQTAHKLGSQPRQVVDYLLANGPSTIAQIREGTSIDTKPLWKVITRLRTKQAIRNDSGTWHLLDKGATSLPVEDDTPPVVRRTDNGKTWQRIYPNVHPCAICGEDAGQLIGGIPLHPGDCERTADEAINKKKEERPPVRLRKPAGSDAVLELDTSFFDPSDPKKGAIKASMKLMKESVKRESVRYHPALFVQMPDLGEEKIWEGRNKWEDLALANDDHLVRLDKNAAYLSAANTRLPVGPLTLDEDPAEAWREKRAGIHQIDVPNPYQLRCGGPFNTRQESGLVWVPTPVVRVLNDYYKVMGHPSVRIHQSYTAPSTEVLLRPWITALRDARQQALNEQNDPLYQHIKFCYSLVISTMGDSKANWEIKRPDWMHIIRAQAYANLWRKAFQAQSAGAQIVHVGNTDEIWIRINDEADRRNADGNFAIGQQLGEWKIKGHRTNGQWGYRP